MSDLPVIELSNVHYVRQNKPILSGINWQIEKGQHWALMGANGSGKTTLLKILTGYEWPTFGQVSVLGQRFGNTNIRELRKLIGWVSAAMEQKLPGNDTVLDIVASGIEASLGLFRSFTKEEYQRAKDALHTLNADHLAKQRFETLSQGEQQKTLIARALVNKPRLLILDEPCAGLDPAARVHFLSDLRYLAAMTDAPSIIIVTHHIEEISDWVNRVLLLKAGQVMATGIPAEALNSDNLTQLFNHPCRVKHTPNSWHLIVD